MFKKIIIQILKIFQIPKQTFVVSNINFQKILFKWTWNLWAYSKSLKYKNLWTILLQIKCDHNKDGKTNIE